MNDAEFPVARVIEGIDAAHAAGLAPIKINTVLKRGVNDAGILQIAERWRGTGTSPASSSSWTWQHQRLAHGRRGALGRDREAAFRRAGRSSRSAPTTPAKWPSAGATSTAAARSASSPR